MRLSLLLLDVRFVRIMATLTLPLTCNSFRREETCSVERFLQAVRSHGISVSVCTLFVSFFSCSPFLLALNILSSSIEFP